MAAAPLPSSGPKRGQKCYITSAFAEAHKSAEMLNHPCILGDPQTKGNKTRFGRRILAFLGDQKNAEMLHHPCILGISHTKGDKMTIGRRTHAFLGAQKRVEM